MSYQDIAHHYEDGPEDPELPALSVSWNWDIRDTEVHLDIDGETVSTVDHPELLELLRGLVHDHYRREGEWKETQEAAGKLEREGKLPHPEINPEHIPF